MIRTISVAGEMPLVLNLY